MHGWRSNGAYYYFYGRPPTKPYEPEATLRQVMARYRELEIPIKYIQLDGMKVFILSTPQSSSLDP